MSAIDIEVEEMASLLTPDIGGNGRSAPMAAN